MLLRLSVPAIALVYLTGCCCCGGGGSSSSTTSGWQERLEEEAAEAIAEKILEAATEIDDVEIDEKTGTISLKTDEGTMVLTGDDNDGGTVDFVAADGSEMHMTAGKGEVPDGFPLKVPPGSEVTIANKATTGGDATYMMIMQHSGTTEDAILAHWEAQLTTLGDVDRAELVQGDNRIVTLTVPSQKDTAVIVSQQDGELISTISLREAGP